MVDAVVLAAGASTRMGKSKALLEVNGQTFLERAVHLLREAGCRYVVAVVDHDDWTERLADVSGAAVVINNQPGAEQIDSLRLGIANLPEGGAGVVVLPVDFPRISTQTVAALIEEFEQGEPAILNPSYHGAAGHPVIFARRVLPELLEPDLPHGARSIIEAHANEARALEVDDPGILIDIDTPADYEQHVSNGS